MSTRRSSSQANDDLPRLSIGSRRPVTAPRAGGARRTGASAAHVAALAVGVAARATPTAAPWPAAASGAPLPTRTARAPFAQYDAAKDLGIPLTRVRLAIDLDQNIASIAPRTARASVRPVTPAPARSPISTPRAWTARRTAVAAPRARRPGCTVRTGSALSSLRSEPKFWSPVSFHHQEFFSVVVNGL